MFTLSATTARQLRTNIRFHIATTQASFRQATEDRLLVFEGTDQVVVAVADGAGGIGGGAKAAEIAIEGVRRTAQIGALAPQSIPHLLTELDINIEADRDAGETTLVLVAISATGELHGASCGDSGALVIGNGGVDDLTSNQQRKKRLGSGRAEPVTFARPQLGGVLVMASDGLFSYLPMKQLAAIVRSHHYAIDTAAQVLVEAVTTPAGGLIDDLALVLASPTFEPRPAVMH